MNEQWATSLEGAVRYQLRDYSWLSGEQMRRAGEQIAAAFPGWTVVVTGGPYRGYDVAYKMEREQKQIELDFYSPRPGLDRLDEVIESMRGRLLLDDDEDKWVL